MTTNIPQEFESFVASLVTRRRSLSEKEVLAESLRLLQARESIADEIQRGFEQVDEGRCANGPEAIAELRGQLLERSEL